MSTHVNIDHSSILSLLSIEISPSHKSCHERDAALECDCKIVPVRPHITTAPYTIELVAQEICVPKTIEKKRVEEK
jgi:hypothetical protein